MANNKKTQEKQVVTLPTPKQIYEHLDKYVIGQDKAKKILSVAVYNHYKRFLINIHNASNPNVEQQIGNDFDGVTIDKSNVLMLGNTGTGKTYMIKIIAKYLGIPCYIADCTKITESGYVGDDVESVISGLLRAANGNIELAQCGIVALDEIDKVSRKGENTSITRDVSGEGVQQSLLKIVEGSTVAVPPNGGRKHPEQVCIDFDTTNVLFIGMGAFDGIEKIIERRTNKSSIGFNSKIEEQNDTISENILDNLNTDDLKKFGLIPELIGRFPIVTHTNPLSEEDMVRIMKDTKNSIIKQYQKMLAIDGVSLTFEDDALIHIAKTANENKTGARGLRGIIENMLTDIMFEYGGSNTQQKVVIDKNYIENNKIKKAA